MVGESYKWGAWDQEQKKKRKKKRGINKAHGSMCDERESVCLNGVANPCEVECNFVDLLSLHYS